LQEGIKQLKITFRHQKEVPTGQVEVLITAAQYNADVQQLERYLTNFSFVQKKLRIEINQEIHELALTEISFLEVYGDYTTVHYGKEQLTVRKSLQALADEIQDAHFVRISRNTILNIQVIKKITSSFSGNMAAQLKSGDEVVISRKYWKAVRKQVLAND
jgi:DNA-binding LytR/AlgR family response regulator